MDHPSRDKDTKEYRHILGSVRCQDSKNKQKKKRQVEFLRYSVGGCLTTERIFTFSQEREREVLGDILFVSHIGECKDGEMDFCIFSRTIQMWSCARCVCVCGFVGESSFW